MLLSHEAPSCQVESAAVGPTDEIRPTALAGSLEDHPSEQPALSQSAVVAASLVVAKAAPVGTAVVAVDPEIQAVGWVVWNATKVVAATAMAAEAMANRG